MATQLKSEVAQAMAAIGVTSPVIPQDADTSAILEETPAANGEQTGDTSLAPEPKAITTEAERAEVTESEDIPAEEKQRRTWQSEAAKAKAEADRIKREAEARMQELELERQKNQALMNMLAGMSSLRGEAQPAEKPAKPVRNKEPELWDFIKTDDYDREDALDPRTASGQAWAKYQRALHRWEANQAIAESREEEQRRAAQELTAKQARALAEQFPEFRNPITGQPDLAKIEQWFNDLSQVEWVTLKRALDAHKQGKPAVANGATPAKAVSAEAELARRANKPGAVAAQSGSEPEAKRTPEELAKFRQIFGDNIYLPPDFNR